MGTNIKPVCDPYAILGLLSVRPYNWNETTIGAYVSSVPNAGLGWNIQEHLTWS